MACAEPRAQKGPLLRSKLWCRGREILNNFEQGVTLHSHCALSPANYIAGPDNERPRSILGGLPSQQSEGGVIRTSFDFKWIFFFLFKAFLTSLFSDEKREARCPHFLNNMPDDAASTRSHPRSRRILASSRVGCSCGRWSSQPHPEGLLCTRHCFGHRRWQ